MKRYRVVATLCHESYRGYDHTDGTYTYYVEASYEEAAENKVRKHLVHAPGRQWIELRSIVKISDDEWDKAFKNHKPDDYQNRFIVKPKRKK